jgi:hypothetical protein
MTKSRAEELLEEALGTRLLLIDANPDDPQTLSSVEHIIDTSQQALNLGLSGRDEVLCRVMLGEALWKKMVLQGSPELATVMKNGVDNAPNVLRILKEYEAALRRDAEIGGEYFGDPVQRAHLKDIELFWLMHSRYLKNSAGNSSAISYLQEKMSSLSYLQGTFLPAISLELAVLAESEGNQETAMRWLHHASNAEVSELDSDSLSAQSKMIAQNELAQRTRPPESAQKGGCFIATAVYGSHDAAEVRFLRQFRDEVLFKTFSGRLFISFYYSFSPYAAEVTRKSEYLKKLIKIFVLNPALRLIRLIMN